MQKRTRNSLRRLARIHFWVTFFAFVTYLLAGFAIGPGFFARDFSDRIRSLADELLVVTATVLGPPATPVVSTTPVCIGGAPRVILDWADDPGTDTWDIDRDGGPLVTGLIASQYTDAALASNTAYSYVVTAYGEMSPGVAVSAPVLVTTLDCPNQPAPVTTIQTIAGVNVETNRIGITITDLRPEITGTTNMPNATVTLTLTNPAVNMQTTASGTGYFSFTVPVNLGVGGHTLTLSAVDEYDPGRVATDTLTFTVPGPAGGDDGGGGGGDDDEGKKKAKKTTPEIQTGGLFGYNVTVDNPGGFAYQGDVLSVSLAVVGGPFPRGARVDIFLVDPKGKDVLRIGGTIVEEDGRKGIVFTKLLPLSLPPGDYTVRADVVIAGAVTSRFATLRVLPLPLVDFGGGAIVTYGEAASAVGSVFLFSLFLLFLLLLLFVREYWLYLHSLRHITERHLARFGFFGAGKGVAS